MARAAAKTKKQDIFSGIAAEEVKEWYRLTHLGRLIETKAYGYIRKAQGWSYHAPFAGHDGIQLAIGRTFRWEKDFLFPYYRDLLTVLVGWDDALRNHFEWSFKGR